MNRMKRDLREKRPEWSPTPKKRYLQKLQCVINSHLTQHVPSKHGLKVLSNQEGSLGLGLDLLDGDAISDLDQGEAVGEVDVEDTLSYID